MKQEKLVIFALAVGLLIVIGVVYFASSPSSPVDPMNFRNPAEISLNPPKTGYQGDKIGSNTGLAGGQPLLCSEYDYNGPCFEGTVFIEPADEPKISLKNTVFQENSGSFLGINDILSFQTPEIIQKGLELSGLASGGPAIAPAQPGKTLTDEEVFLRLWPEIYRNSLIDIQNVVVKNGIVTGNLHESALFPDNGPDTEPLANWYIPENEKVTVFKSDADIYKANLLILNYAFKSGYITETEYDNFKKGITELLPKIIESEKSYIRRGGAGSQSKVLPGYQNLASGDSVGFLIKNLFDGLKYVFYIAEPANAAWVRGADCYKDDAPAPGAPPLGYNGATFCCNCGLVHRSSCRWRFRQDCGVNGSSCDVQLGCLNGICGGSPNAIWDSSTGICGCG